MKDSNEFSIINIKEPLPFVCDNVGLFVRQRKMSMLYFMELHRWENLERSLWVGKLNFPTKYKCNVYFIV